MKTRAEQMRDAINRIGRITNQGNPKRIKFTVPSGTTLDSVIDSLDEVSGYVIRKDGSGFVAVDLKS